MHQLEIYADNGDLVDYKPFCSDNCHLDYCHDHGISYDGWNGCAESSQDQWCAYCGVRCDIDAEGECTWAECLPIVVRSFRDTEGPCAHGIPSWIAPDGLVA